MDIEANIDFLMGQNLRGKAISGWLARNAKAKRQAVLGNLRAAAHIAVLR